MERESSMRDPARIDRILSSIRRIWILAPDLRLAQLLANGCDTGEFHDAFYYEDDKLERDLGRLEQLLYIRPRVHA